jgi:CheY-like chemotaxis protein
MAEILVVDDDPDFVEVTRIILEANGYEVASAADGKEALARMRQARPDLVLLDVMMAHVLEGLEVSKEMQADTQLEKIPIIMVSSITESPHAGEFPTDEYLPVDDWISKPVQPADLLEKIKRCLR